MSWPLRALTAVPENQSSLPSNHMVAHSLSIIPLPGIQSPLWLLWVPHMWHTDIHTGKSPIHIKIKSILKFKFVAPNYLNKNV